MKKPLYPRLEVLTGCDPENGWLEEDPYEFWEGDQLFRGGLAVLNFGSAVSSKKAGAQHRFFLF